MFIAGVLTGVLVKDKLVDFFIKVLESRYTRRTPQKNKYFFMAKITDKNAFDENFPILPTKYRTQPHWDFYGNKNIIKIEINENFNFEEKEFTFDEFLNNTTLDIEVFKSFAELSVYIHYFVDNKEYINVYTKDSIIKRQDFTINDTELSRKYNSIICATFNINGKDIYITKYFKKFLNNTVPLKTDNLLMYYDGLDTLNANLQIINNENITIHQLHELI